MAKFSIGAAAVAGFGLLARSPVAALVWAILWAALIALVAVPFAGPIGDFITASARYGDHPDPASILPQLGNLAAFILLASLFSLTLGAVVSCAVYRAVQTPDASAFAYLRLGDQEVLVLLVNFAKSLVIGAAGIPLAMVLGALTLIAQAAGPAVANLFHILGDLLVQGILVWVRLRLGVSGPMTYADHRFRLFESWTLTRGQNLRLAGVALLLAAFSLAVYLALATLGAVAGAFLWAGHPLHVDMPSLLSQPPAVWGAVLAPYIALAGVLIVIGGAILTPLLNAPWVRIWRELAPSGAAATTA